MFQCFEMCAFERYSFSDAIANWQQRTESDWEGTFWCANKSSSDITNIHTHIFFYEVRSFFHFFKFIKLDVIKKVCEIAFSIFPRSDVISALATIFKLNNPSSVNYSLFVQGARENFPHIRWFLSKKPPRKHPGESENAISILFQ